MKVKELIEKLKLEDDDAEVILSADEEEKKAIELLENIKDSSWATKYIMSSDSKNAEILLNLIEKQEKQIEKLKKGE